MICACAFSCDVFELIYFQLNCFVISTHNTKSLCRPAWDETTTPAELDRAERDAFLEWRRDLARAEEASQLTITPYEKNLEVWKQLYV